jgi:hypothetical protein
MARLANSAGKCAVRLTNSVDFVRLTTGLASVARPTEAKTGTIGQTTVQQTMVQPAVIMTLILFH